MSMQIRTRGTEFPGLVQLRSHPKMLRTAVITNEVHVVFAVIFS